MEKEGEWKNPEEEDEEIVEEVNGSLERKKKKGSIAAANGEKHSVFFEAEEGVWKCRHCTWTYLLSGPGIDFIQNQKSSFQVDSHMLNKLGAHIHTSIKGVNDKDFPRLGEKNEISVSENNIQNGNAAVEANDLNTHNTVDAEVDNHHELGNLVLNFNFGSAINNGNGSTRNEGEIQECIEPKPEVQTKLISEEYDIEKIIEEQETHDLYCPNCHSCITKRVILRKRKRTNRENKNDLRPEKLQHVPEVTTASMEVVDNEDKTVFRCLSCFSFFIPTERSFNIFRLFGKKDGSSNLGISQKIPTQNENQVPLLSGSSSTKNNDNKAGVPLLVEENNAISNRDPSSHLKDNSSAMPTVGAMNFGAKENKTGINDTGGVPLFAEENNAFSNQDPSSRLKDNSSPMPTVGAMNLRAKENKKRINDTGVPLFAEENNAISNLDPSTHLMDNSSPVPTVGAMNLGANDTEENNAISNLDPSTHLMDNSSPVPTVGAMNLGANDTVMGDSYPSHGQLSKQDQRKESSYSATTMLPDRSTAESYSNGVTMNNSAQQEKPTYASIISKAEKPSSNSALTESMEQEDTHSFLHTTVQNNMLDISIRISDSTGGFKGTETQGDKTRYPVQAVSEDPSAGAPYTKGILIGPPGGNPSNLASSTSDGICTSNANLNGSVSAVTSYISSGNNVTKPVDIMQSTTPIRDTTENNQINYGSEASSAADTLIDMGTHGTVSSSRVYEWDILKSIVYGGLIEVIMSLTLVASAAGAGSSTINICALGLANLVGGLFLLAHDLSELRTRHDAETSNQIGQQPSQYWDKLGKREHAKRHTFISILSFIIFGALPPIIYAFTFRSSDHKEHKIIAMATSSLFCIALLAIGKAHVKSQNGYLKSIFYYLGIALPASGLSYVAGVMIDRLFVELGLFDPTINYPPPHLLSSY